MLYNLEQYIKTMEAKGYTQWEIGWESLPKYIGHKIYNTVSKVVGTVEWERCPNIIDDDGNDIQFCASEFRHGSGDWIYKIGENYETIY